MIINRLILQLKLCGIQCQLFQKKNLLSIGFFSQDNSVLNGTSSDCSSPLFTLDSLKSKRIIRSPLKDLNEIKRFKNNNDNNELYSTNTKLDLDYSSKPKENRMRNKLMEKSQKLNKHTNSNDSINVINKYVSDNFDKEASNYCLPDVKLQKCRAAICGSSKEVINRSTMQTTSETITEEPCHKFSRMISNQLAVREICNDTENQSLNITDIESLASSSPLFESINDSIECESSKKLHIQSPTSSPHNVLFDSESHDIIDQGHDSMGGSDTDEIIDEINDDVDANVDSLISTDNSECDIVSMSLKERSIISTFNSSKSDETFFSQNNSLEETIIECEKDFQMSQKISQDCLSLHNSDNKTISIDQNISSDNTPPVCSIQSKNFDNYPKIQNPIIKKKRKPKKGSLAGRLQAILTGQISFLRIWRHRMAQSDAEITNKQCIVLKINHCISQCNRQYFIGTVIGDSYNLLENIDQKSYSSEFKNVDKTNMLPVKNVTILTIPEIVGTLSIKEKGVLEVYPPWEVIDTENIVLSVLYFRVLDNNSSPVTRDDKTNKKMQTVKKFNCPCLAAKKLVESCNTKFTNDKPNIMQYLFVD